MEADFYFYRRGDKNMNDKKMTKRNYSKNTLALLTVMVMLMATLLTACGSGKEANTSAAEDTTNVEAVKEADSTETTETEEVAEVETAVEEPTAEPTPEPVVYEGIDMESTLPGLEWIETFNGVIDEPKMVIFNDDTNKKVIVENGQEVEFVSDSDNLAIFYPKDKEVVENTAENVKIGLKGFLNIATENDVRLIGKMNSNVENGSKVDVEWKVGVDGEDIVLKATLVIKK